jgi:ABC-2 type transport system permease protein
VNAVLVVARKELRSSFQSPVALIFIGLFLVAVLYSFFGFSAFFARRIADVRPLFEWLPLLLILLVAAVTMRQWAEETKMGTLEVLLTLPVSTRDLVLGKFAAGVALVAIALGMTTPIPLLVAWLGPLDWGPVVGGYVGALLLGATYVAIGLCVSARTDNQVVALMLTLVVAGALYFLGSDRVIALFGNVGGDILRALGTGSRFESIERGVLDLRDLAYYVGLAAFFLCLNWLFLEQGRLDAGSEAGRARRLALWTLTLLVAGNVVASGLWLAPLTRARVDLTEGGEYSISETTVDTLAQLAEPLRIDGYFSERTHPLLAPLVPQIRDLLREYEVYGGGRVQVGIADPNADEQLEGELNEQYQIRSVPFRVADRHQQAVVNSYFHLLVRYGDQYASLGFEELIDVHADDDGIQVRLRNLEYDLTRTIKRVSQDFQNMEYVFSRLPEPLTLSLYTTPDTLPEGFDELVPRIRKVASELAGESDSKLVFAEVDPRAGAREEAQALQQRLAEEFGIEPLAVDLFGRQTFYLDLLLEGSDKPERILPRSDLSESDLRVALEAAVRRMTPGQLKTVGLFTRAPEAPPMNPNLPAHMQPPPPHPDYQILEQMLGEEYEVTRLSLDDGIVPDVIDVLVVGKTGMLGDHEKFAVDQYLMRGGKVVVLTSRFEVRPERGGLVAAPVTDGPFEMLETWGVKVEPALVMDPQNAAFPIPVTETRGGFRMQRIRMVPYPFFPDVRGDGFAAGPVFAGLTNVTTPWASPLEVAAPEGVASEILIRSSAGSWRNTTGEIEPDFSRHPDDGFGSAGATGSLVLGASLSGRFSSYFAERPSPLFEGGAADGGADGNGEAGADRTGRTLKQSLPDARLVVLAAPEMVSDLMLQLAGQPGGEVHRSNLQLLQNLVDWSVEDTDLLAIRSAGVFARTLRPVSEQQARAYETGIVVLTAGMLGAATVFPARRRRRAVPIPIAARAPQAETP